MGFRLFPGHVEDSAGHGWLEHSHSNELIHNIKVSHSNEVFSKVRVDKDSERDKRSSFYSIPNPWATAYLFYVVMKDTRHPLRQELIELLVNFFYDLYYGNLELVYLFKPEKSSSFYLLWDLAPDFIKYHRKNIPVLPLFKDPVSKDVIGGLSRKSLVWLAPTYEIKKSFRELWEDNPEVFRYLKAIKEKKKWPEKDTFDKFWSGGNLNRIDSLDALKDGYEEIADSPDDVDWLLKKKSIDPTLHGFYSQQLDKITIREEDVVSGKPFGEKTSIVRKKLQAGEKVYIDGKEVLTADRLVEDNFVMLSTDKGFDSKIKDPAHDVFIFPELWDSRMVLYPYKKELITSGAFKESSYQFLGLSATRDYGEAKLTLNLKGKRLSVNIEKKIVGDIRGIAVWPPFPSQLDEAYVIEYLNEQDDPDGFRDYPRLEFFGETGAEIPSKKVKEFSEDTNYFRLYRLEGEHVFPHFIRLQTKNASATGFMKLEPRPKEPKKKNVVVAIDFGSSHTTVAYQKEQEGPELMTFEKSRPIVFYPKEKYHYYVNILTSFVPDSILLDPPREKDEFDANRKNWIPFRTLWKIFGGPNEEKFLQDGVIPFAYNPEQLKNKSEQFQIEQHLKWSSESRFRDSFLKFLLKMVQVEAEAMNFSNLKIKWSYPRAFGLEKNTMATFWMDFSKKTPDNVSVVKDGYSEAVATSQYFIDNDSLVLNKMAVTADIGGESCDIAFFNSGSMFFQDSVRFAGEHLAVAIQGAITDVLNEIGKQDGVSVGNTAYEDMMRMWPGVSPDWGGKIGDIADVLKGQLGVIYEKIALFYSGLCFYIGLHLNDMKYMEPLNQVAFAGNGIQFLRLYSMGTAIEEANLGPFVELMKKMLAVGHNYGKLSFDGLYGTRFLFSREPKKEVALGMLPLSEDGKELGDTGRVKKMLGLDIKLEKQHLSWNNWTDEIECKVLANEGLIDFGLFTHFLEEFYKSFNSIEEFRKWKISRELNLSREFKEKVVNYLLRQNSNYLTSPLFFIALSTWLQDIETVARETRPTRDLVLPGIEIQVTDKGDGTLIKGDSGYYYIAREDGKYRLYVKREILDKSPHPNTIQILKGFFEISDEGERAYKLVKPGEVNWDEQSGEGKTIDRGIIYY